MDILATMAEAARIRYSGKHDAHIEQAAFEHRLETPCFATVLRQNRLSLIAEVKKASPSQGIITETFNPVAQAEAYVRSGAHAVSVLTEPTQFLGSNAYLKQISDAVPTPVLRKDFIVTTYQILEARLLGSSAVLLIAAILDAKSLETYLALAASLGLDALVEVHDEQELDRALSAGATLIGINNRNLHTFVVDIRTSLKLRPRIPDTCTKVSESGIRSKAEALQLKAAGFDAILVGEHLMRANNTLQAVQDLLV